MAAERVETISTNTALEANPPLSWYHQAEIAQQRELLSGQIARKLTHKPSIKAQGLVDSLPEYQQTLIQKKEELARLMGWKKYDPTSLLNENGRLKRDGRLSWMVGLKNKALEDNILPEWSEAQKTALEVVLQAKADFNKALKAQQKIDTLNRWQECINQAGWETQSYDDLCKRPYRDKLGRNLQEFVLQRKAEQAKLQDELSYTPPSWVQPLQPSEEEGATISRSSDQRVPARSRKQYNPLEWTFRWSAVAAVVGFTLGIGASAVQHEWERTQQVSYRSWGESVGLAPFQPNRYRLSLQAKYLPTPRPISKIIRPFAR